MSKRTGRVQVSLASAARTFVTNLDSFGNYAFSNVPAGTFSLALAGIGVIKLEHCPRRREYR